MLNKGNQGRVANLILISVDLYDLIVSFSP